MSPTSSTPKVSVDSAASEAAASGAAEVPQQIQGRSVFGVETTAAGVAVNTLFLAQDGRLVAMPAVFPSLPYALEQIEELRQLVTQHFSQAAQVGAQVIAAQNQKAAQASASAQEENTAPAA